MWERKKGELFSFLNLVLSKDVETAAGLMAADWKAFG